MKPTIPSEWYCLLAAIIAWFIFRSRVTRRIVSVTRCAIRRQYFDLFLSTGAVDFKEEVSISAVSAGKDYLALGTTDGECIIQPLTKLKVNLYLYSQNVQ